MLGNEWPWYALSQPIRRSEGIEPRPCWRHEAASGIRSRVKLVGKSHGDGERQCLRIVQLEFAIGAVQGGWGLCPGMRSPPCWSDWDLECRATLPPGWLDGAPSINRGRD